MPPRPDFPRALGALLPLVTTCLLSAGAPAHAASSLIPLPEPFAITGTVIEDRDVSTITRGPDGVGLIAADEGAVIQVLVFATYGSGARIGEGLALAQPPTLEIDFEASTWHDGWFYVNGSHGTTKKRGTYEPDRAAIFRFRLIAGTRGLGDLQRASLDATRAAIDELVPFLRQPLQERGLNIEGLAARTGDPHLYVGLRSPNLDGDALILRLDPEPLFAGAPTPAELLRAAVGAQLGIRAMTAVRDGFVLVVGSAGSEAVRRSELVHWDPATGATRRLGVFPVMQRGKQKGKEEGIMVLAEADDGTLDLVIVYDGIEGGGFQRFRYVP